MGFPEEFLNGNKESVLLGQGAHSSAVRTSNGDVLKDADEDMSFLRERQQTLEQVDRTPQSEVVFVDEEFLIKMAEANMSHSEAVNQYGFEQVIEEDFQMFVEMAGDGAVFEDFKPANIGYFHDKAEGVPVFDDVEALPIDLYDCEAINTEELRLIDFQAITDVYMTGNSSYSGLTGSYDLTPEEAYEATIKAIADDPDEIIDSRFYDVDDATREFYRNNLR